MTHLYSLRQPFQWESGFINHVLNQGNFGGLRLLAQEKKEQKRGEVAGERESEDRFFYLFYFLSLLYKFPDNQDDQKQIDNFFPDSTDPQRAPDSLL